VPYHTSIVDKSEMTSQDGRLNLRRSDLCTCCSELRANGTLCCSYACLSHLYLSSFYIPSFSNIWWILKGEISYISGLYWIISTMCTVGLGDITFLSDIGSSLLSLSFVLVFSFYLCCCHSPLSSSFNRQPVFHENYRKARMAMWCWGIWRINQCTHWATRAVQSKLCSARCRYWRSDALRDRELNCCRRTWRSEHIQRNWVEQAAFVVATGSDTTNTRWSILCGVSQRTYRLLL